MPSNKKLLQAAAGSAGGDNLFVEDVFSTYLYAGTGSTNNIVNGVDLTEGGLVWIKTRDDIEDHNLVDSERGSNKGLESNTTDAETGSAGFSTFNSNGFTLTSGFGKTNSTSSVYTSWSFRKAAGFFDIVTYTGNGTSGRTVAHSLGSVPKMMLIKRTSASGDDWAVYHSSLGATKLIALNTTSATVTNPWLTDTTPTDSVFTLNNYGFINASGSSYVAYLFGDDAVFGTDADEQICKVGSYTGNNTVGRTVDFGFEPQWVLIKPNTNDDWYLFDTMREWTTDISERLRPNTSDEGNRAFYYIPPNATGITFNASSGGALNANGREYIYMAIRRPMKVPEAGTEVFNIGTYGANRDNSSTSTYYAGFPVDMAIKKVPVNATANNFVSTRMLGTTDQKTNSSAAERTGETEETFDSNTHWNSAAGTSSTSYSWMFKRAPQFFDVVCYNGTGSTHAVTHNLGIIPDLLICKPRTITNGWFVTSPSLGLANSTYPNATRLDSTVGLIGGGTNYFGQQSTSTNFYPLGTNNVSGYPYIAYLFGTVSGVSKVGTYTGTGNNVDVNCGFSAGAKFVLIKRVNDGYSGDWYVWDSVRGIVSGNDPYLLLNTTAAEVTNTDYIDPLASGFTVTSSAPAALNASGGTYIFLAIA